MIQNSRDPQQVYIDTQTGALSYLSPATSPPSKFSPGAIITNFLHLGEGTSVTTPLPGNPGFFNAGPGNYPPLLYPLFFHSAPILPFWLPLSHFPIFPSFP